ncbi:lytic transglycosylase domain-containing protein [Ureibacillus aquaedulcis]|uniref:Lytic transglycosylase domain-containing protein n=1 Tax=Ureibacillus aquaedulcis TaxID=3058421 RepID=A0ABT8GM09_9BACL|nr:lytic transglycosylase domain-containing protein [Ureibacillus sp. BA0131]MDN4492458.1 lytic transglycosylase domain-containing protein [Ureibacillus sp. BA0131]
MKSKKKKKKTPILSPGVKLFLIILLIPISITVYSLVFFTWENLRNLPIIQNLSQGETEDIQGEFDLQIPEEYIPVYISAAKAYHIPWTLLAAHHRVETRFSTMKSLVSPVGAEGHMQFMPCTFVGWSHPTCSDLGEGDIPEAEKTNPEVIKKYGGYGVDANGDGVADPFDIEDAIFSAANYLSRSGASDGELKKAIFNYNHSEEYVDDILYYYHQYEQQSEDLLQSVK